MVGTAVHRLASGISRLIGRSGARVFGQLGPGEVARSESGCGSRCVDSAAWQRCAYGGEIAALKELGCR